MNPNETKGFDAEESDSEEKFCPTCGMEQKDWSAKQGQGYQQADEIYCCRGCAEGTGCMCGQESEKDVAKSSSRRSGVSSSRSRTKKGS